MARKRMFDLEIINQDSFFDLPIGAKALYFLLGMEADDEGFVSPRKVLKLYGGTEDDLKILALKGYIIPFKTGVIVITDWKRNNYLDKNRIKETIYQSEKNQISYNEKTEKYELVIDEVKQPLNSSLTNVKQMLNQNRIEENRIEENIKEKNITKKERKEKMLHGNTLVTKCNTEKEIDKEIDIEIDNKKKNDVYFENEEVNNLFIEFLKIRKKIKAVNSDLAIKKLVNKLNKYEDNVKVKMLENSIVNSWKDVYELKVKKETPLEKLQREIREAEEEERVGKNDKS